MHYVNLVSSFFRTGDKETSLATWDGRNTGLFWTSQPDPRRHDDRARSSSAGNSLSRPERSSQKPLVTELGPNGNRVPDAAPPARHFYFLTQQPRALFLAAVGVRQLLLCAYLHLRRRGWPINELSSDSLFCDKESRLQWRIWSLRSFFVAFTAHSCSQGLMEEWTKVTMEISGLVDQRWRKYVRICFWSVKQGNYQHFCPKLPHRRHWKTFCK